MAPRSWSADTYCCDAHALSQMVCPTGAAAASRLSRKHPAASASIQWPAATLPEFETIQSSPWPTLQARGLARHASVEIRCHGESLI